MPMGATDPDADGGDREIRLRESTCMDLNQYLITLDVDWASDEVIGECARMLLEKRVKATWLITHDSAGIQELAGHGDLFELGIHPNFHEGSTQGSTPEAVLNYLRAIVPGARTVRTHDLFQSSTLLRKMVGEYDIRNDLSLLLPDTPNITPHEFHLPEGILRRFPTFWEDDAEMLRPQPAFSLDDPRYQVHGLKVFTFHPILVAMNSSTLDDYQELKSKHATPEVSMSDLRPYTNDSGPGAGSLFRELIEHIAQGPTAPGLTISELADGWRASQHGATGSLTA